MIVPRRSRRPIEEGNAEKNVLGAFMDWRKKKKCPGWSSRWCWKLGLWKTTVVFRRLGTSHSCPFVSPGGRTSRLGLACTRQLLPTKLLLRPTEDGRRGKWYWLETTRGHPYQSVHQPAETRSSVPDRQTLRLFIIDYDITPGSYDNANLRQ